MGSTIVDQDFPYDILRRGSKDASRHNKRVQDAARKQLGDIISQEDIITSEGNKKVRVKLRNLDQYRFIYNKDYHDSIGRDQFDELDEKEIIYKPSKGGDGSSSGSGSQKPEAGEEIYEAEFTIDQLTEMMMEDLELPDLDETKKNEIISDTIEYNSLRKKNGLASCLDKKRTLMANILRRAKLKTNEKLPLIEDDLRYRTWNITQERHSNAVVILMLDRSGSMGNEKIYAIKALFFWIVRFLRLRYDNVVIRFVSHDTEAKELTEKEFFTISEDGGTRISAAYKYCRDLIVHNYPSSLWNIFCLHASDGDTWGDKDECVDLIKEMVKLGINLFGYTEVKIGDVMEGDTMLKQIRKDLASVENVITAEIDSLDNIIDVLKAFLRHTTRQSVR